MDHVEILYEEFDKDKNGKVDFPELKTMMKYLKTTVTQKRKSVRLVQEFGNLCFVFQQSCRYDLSCQRDHSLLSCVLTT